MRKLFSFLLRTTVAACLCWLPTAPAHAQAPAWQMAVGIGTASASRPNTPVRWQQFRCDVIKPADLVSHVDATAADSSGNVYLAGYFSDSVTFGATTLSKDGRGNHRRLYVAKWNPATGFVWAQKMGRGSGRVVALAVSGRNVYVAGSFGDSAFTFGTTRLTKASGFVAKLTDEGRTITWAWAQPVDGTDYNAVSALAVNGSSVYVAGSSWAPTRRFGATTLTGASGFVAKLTDEGRTSAWAWAQPVGRYGRDCALALAVNGSSVYVAGSFRDSTIRFGAITLALPSSPTGMYAGFVAKLTDAGKASAWAWAQPVGGRRRSRALALTLAASGSSVYVAGSFQDSTIHFGATTLTLTSHPTRTLYGPGPYDGFVAKLTDADTASTWVWAQPVSGIYLDDPYALAVKGNSVYVAGNFHSVYMGADNFYSPAVSFGTKTLTNASTGSQKLGEGFVAKLTDAGTASAWAWALPVGGKGRDKVSTLTVSRGRVYVGGSFRDSAITFGATTLTIARKTTIGFLAALADPLPRQPRRRRESSNP